MNTIITISGALIAAVGILGTFMKISQNDGALAMAGSVLLAGGVIAEALRSQKKN
jgi:hypothetical protein